MDMIQKQFTTAFWNTEIKVRGAEALQLPRSDGKVFLGLLNLNPKWKPMEEGRWSHDSSFERYADSDRFVLPGQKFSKGTPLFDHFFIKPDRPFPNFVMGRAEELWLEQSKESIKHFDGEGNQTTGPSGYVEYPSTEKRANPPIFTTKKTRD